MGTHRIIVKDRPGPVGKHSGPDYIDLNAACLVVPDTIKSLPRDARKRHFQDGYDEVYFDKDLNPSFLRVKASTKGMIAISAMITLSRLEFVFGSIAKERQEHTLKRGHKWQYDCDEEGQLSFEIHTGIRERGPFADFEVTVEDIQANPRPSGGRPYLVINPYAIISGEDPLSLSWGPFQAPIPGTGSSPKQGRVDGLIAYLDIWG